MPLVNGRFQRICRNTAMVDARLLEDYTPVIYDIFLDYPHMRCK